MAIDTTITVDEEDRLRQAARLLSECFGRHVRLPYLPGKTSFRDELYARWELSLLEAEELCDSLERGGLIVYREPQAEDEESGGWEIAEIGYQEPTFP